MAAYEAFAGDTLTGKLGSATMRGQFRGGGIRIDEIPNLPRVDPSMPEAKYPDIGLTQRYEYQKPVTGFEGRAAALQQQPLPGSFAKAAAITSEAAGKGEMVMAKNIAQGTASIAGGLDSVASVLSKIQREASDSKDSTDTIRYQELEQTTELKFRADMEKEQVPVQEWPDRWQKDYAPQFLNDASKLGVYTTTRDKIQARATGMVDRMTLSTTIDGAKKQRQDDMDLSTSYFNNSIEKKDWQGASEANENLLRHDYINKGKYEENKWKIENAQNKQVLAETMTHNKGPEYLLNQIDAIEHPDKGKHADPEFQWLRNDAVARQTAKEEAQRIKNNREVVAAKGLEDDVAKGIVKPKDIEAEGEKRGVRASEAKSIKKAKEAEDPKYDGKLATKVNTAIVDYDWNKLPGEKDSMATYYSLKEDIRKLPQSMQPELNQRLEKRLEDLKKGTGPTLDEQRKAAVYKHIDQLDEGGYFGETGEQKIDGKMVLPKNDPVALAKYQEHFDRVESIKKEIDDLIKKDPNITLEKLHEEAGKIAQRHGVGALAAMKPRTLEDIKATIAPTTPRVTTQSLAEEAAKKAQALKIAPGDTGTPPSIFRQTPVSSFRNATVAPGQSYQMAVTAFTPGKGDPQLEGRNTVASRSGPAYTLEQYQNGTVPWVSVAMDSKSPLQGKFLKNDAYPNVIFKVEDTGSAFEGKGNSRIDIAFSDPSKGRSFSDTGTFGVINESDANNIAAEARGQGRIGATGGSIPGVNPALSSRFNQIQQMWGQPLDVISGYRSVAHNKAVGGASGSLHTHGNAIDIATGHLSHAERLQLIQIAVANGITGIGVYANNLHFDIGPRRAWGPSYHSDSIPDWARPTLKRLMLA